MADVEGLTPEELEEQGAAVEAVVAAALALVAEQAAASVLAGIPAVIGTGLPAYPWVSLDDVAIVPTLWLRQLDEQVMPAVRVVFDQTAEHVHGQIQAAVDADPTLYGTPEFDLPGEVVEPPPVPEIPDVTAEQLMAAARNRLVGIGDTLWADIRQQIVEGIGLGESIEQLGKRIEATAGVAEPRARTIVRTEVTSVSNGAAIAQARSAGVPMTKSWLDTADDRTRPTHKEAGRTQQRVPLDQPFEVGGFQLDFPGDPSGPPQEVINERCAIGFELGVPEPVVAAVGRKTAVDPYVRDSEGKFAKTGTPDLSKMTVPELRAEVKRRGLKGLSKAPKAQLVEALRQLDKADSGSGKVGKVDSLPRMAKRQPALAAAKATNPNFGSTSEGPTYPEQGKVGERWTPALGPLPAGAFEENCTNAVNAFEMRMRGYDVTAAPLDVLSKYGYAAGRTYQEFDELFTEAWRLSDGKPHGRSMASQKWRSFAEIDAEIDRDWPDGGRGVITVGKHVFNVVKERGKARYVEAQYDATPSRNVTRLYKSRFKGYDGWSDGIQEGKLIRLDDLVPTDSILETVEAAK